MRARMNDDENRIAPFDRNARRRARERAVKRYGEFAFLKDAVSEDLAGRAAGFDRRWARCLDLGAHDGRLGARIGAKTLIATDSAYGFAAPLRGVVCDEDRLPFAEDSFDIVVSALSLHSVNDLPGALVQIRRLLRPGGVFLAAFVGGASFAAQRSALLHAEMEASSGASPRLLPMVDPAEAPGLLQRAGFVDPVVDQHWITVKYRGAQDMVRDLRGMGETNVLAARERAPMGRGQVGALLAAAHTGADQRIEAQAEILTLTGRAPEAPGE
ncbi:SAM-dependent methyltransferase [Pacificimonas flava]|uniref:SAM-dependent methyltransferase n=2 Tax=Pacificimonas flava TaxID=1234595 RepID=M2SAL2_9SPHN|nr:SAM-dependent methyltransferase [Pacificimonas flava]